MSSASRRGRGLRLAMATLAVVAAATVSMAGCTATTAEDTSDPTVTAMSDGGAGAPKECANAFPQAIGTPSLSDVESLPADWPEPPAGSTLCITASALGDRGTESLSYATQTSADAVLAHYERLLKGFKVSREPAPTGGEMLVGDSEEVSFQLRAGDGTFVIALKPAG